MLAVFCLLLVLIHAEVTVLTLKRYYPDAKRIRLPIWGYAQFLAFHTGEAKMTSRTNIPIMKCTQTLLHIILPRPYMGPETINY